MNKKLRQQAPAPSTPVPSTAPVPAVPKPGRAKTWIIISAILAVIILAGAGVLLQSGFMTIPLTPPALPGPGLVPGLAPGSVSFSGAPAGKPVHGTITSGAVTTAAQGSVSAAGGTISVNQPGSAINGLVFTVPAGAYPAGQQVTVSSAPVTAHTFGNNFNPATPLISVNAGGAYADDPILVTIPVTIPEDQFAMAFYYDDVNKKLEGIPTASQDEKSLTIATRHFSNIIVSFISKGSLDGIAKADSGFRPGTDDWEFTNDGSVLAQNGHCAGQSATMLWYYTEQRQNADAPPLFNRYDNNGRDPAALQLERDNTGGYRFASVMQKLTDQQKYWNNPGSVISNVSDVTTFREFKYAILLTGEPQYVGIYRPGGGHAIVCYEVSGNTLWIADPNYPGKERMITLNGSTLGPYTSGASSTDIRQNGVRVYPTINYIAKTAFFSWPTLAAEYAKMKDGTIGTGSFPAYKLLVIVTNDDGTQETLTLDAGTNKGVQRLDLKGKTVSIWPKGDISATNSGDIIVYAPDGSVLNNHPTNLNPLILKEGSNLVAVELVSEKSKSWVGFDWLDLVYKPAETKDSAASAGHYTATVYQVLPAMKDDNACDGYDWYSDDPACDSRTATGRMQTLCGRLPAQCIDTSWNGGVLMTRSFLNTQEGPVTHRILDGYERTFDKNGATTTRAKYVDDEQTELCSPSLRLEKGNFACQVQGDAKLYYYPSL